MCEMSMCVQGHIDEACVPAVSESGVAVVMVPGIDACVEHTFVAYRYGLGQSVGTHRAAFTLLELRWQLYRTFSICAAICSLGDSVQWVGE